MKALYAAILFCCVLSHAAQADAAIENSRCRLSEDVLLMSVDADLDLADEPVNAIKSGLNLHLVYELEFKKADSRFARTKRFQYRQNISYNPVSQQFIVENPNTLKRLSFSSINDALFAVSHLHDLPFPTGMADDKSAYRARIRLRLDDDLLPVSLRLDAWFNPDWRIKSEWSPCPLNY